MLLIWFIFLGASFLVSVLTLTRLQTRIIRKLGWRALQRDPLLHYWVEISALERVLLWCGISAFLLTLLGAAVWKLVALSSRGDR